MSAPMPSRVLPIPEDAVAGYLRGVLGSAVTVESVPTSDPYGRTPFVLVRATRSGDTPHWGLLDAPVLDVECWAAPEKRDAADLAEACRVALYAAPVRLDAGAVLSRVETSAYPSEVRLEGQPGGIYHYAATYRLLIRPTP